MSNEGNNKIRSFVFIPESIENITGVYYFMLEDNFTIVQRIQSMLGVKTGKTGNLPDYYLPSDFINNYKETSDYIEINLNYKIAMVYSSIHYRDIPILNLVRSNQYVRLNGIEYHPEYFNVFLQKLTNDKSKLIFTDKIIIYNKNKLCIRTENELIPVDNYTRIYNDTTYLINNEIYTFINSSNFYYDTGSMKIEYKSGRNQMLQFRMGLFDVSDFLENFVTAIWSHYYIEEHGGLTATGYDIHYSAEINSGVITVKNLRSIDKDIWHNNFAITVRLPFIFLHNFPYYLDTSQEIIYYNSVEFDKYTPDYTYITINNEKQCFILPEENQSILEIIPLNFIDNLKSYSGDSDTVSVVLKNKLQFTEITFDCLENYQGLFVNNFNSTNITISKTRTIENKYVLITDNIYYNSNSLFVDNYNKFLIYNNESIPLENLFMSYYDFINSSLPRTLKKLNLKISHWKNNYYTLHDYTTDNNIKETITIDNYFLNKIPGNISTNYNNIQLINSGIITKDSAIEFNIPDINFNPLILIQKFVPGVTEITENTVKFDKPVAFIYENSKNSMCFSKTFSCFEYTFREITSYSNIQKLKEYEINSYYTEIINNNALPPGKYKPDYLFKLAYYITTNEIIEANFNESELVIETSVNLPAINDIAFDTLFTEEDNTIKVNLKNITETFEIDNEVYYFPDQLFSDYSKTLYVARILESKGYFVVSLTSGYIKIFTDSPVNFKSESIQLIDNSFAFYFLMNKDINKIYRTKRIYSTNYSTNIDIWNDYFSEVYELTENGWELIDKPVNVSKITDQSSAIICYFNISIRLIYAQRYYNHLKLYNTDFINGSEYSVYYQTPRFKHDYHFTENYNGVIYNNSFKNYLLIYAINYLSGFIYDNVYEYNHYDSNGVYKNDDEYNYNEFSHLAVNTKDDPNSVNKLMVQSQEVDFTLLLNNKYYYCTFPTMSGDINRTFELFDIILNNCFEQPLINCKRIYGKLELTSDFNFKFITNGLNFYLAILKYFNKISNKHIGDIYEPSGVDLKINGNIISIPKKLSVYFKESTYYYLNVLGPIVNASGIYINGDNIVITFPENVKLNYSTAMNNNDTELFTVSLYNETNNTFEFKRPDKTKNYLIHDSELIEINSDSNNLIVYENRLYTKSGLYYLTKEQTASFISDYCEINCTFDLCELKYTLESIFTPPPCLQDNWFCKNINDTNEFTIDSKYYLTTTEFSKKLIENDEIDDTVIFSESFINVEYIPELIPSIYGIECSERFHEYTVIDNRLIKVPKSTPEFTEINGQLTDGSELISEINSENNEIKIMYNSQEFIVPLPLGYYNNSELTEILGIYISLAINKEIDAVVHGRMLKIISSIEFIETNSIDYFMFIDNKLSNVSGNDYYQLGRIRFNENLFILPFITENTYAGYFEFYDNDSEINLKESLGCSFSTWEFINPPVIATEITEDKVKFNNPIMLYLSTSTNYKITDYIQCKNNRDYKEHVKYFNDNNRKIFLYFKGIEYSNNSFQFIQRDIYADRIFYSEYFYYNKSFECIIDPDKNLIVPAFDSNGNQLIQLNKVNDYEFIYNNEYYYRINNVNNIINIVSYGTRTNGDFKLINSITNETYTLYKLASILSYPYATSGNGTNFIFKNHDYYYINNYKLTNYYQFAFARDNTNAFKPGHTYSELMFKIIDTPALTLFENIPRNVYGYIIQWPRKHIHCISSNCNQIRINDEIREIIPGAYIEPQLELVKQLNINITKGDIIVNNNISFDNLTCPLTNQYYFSKFSKSKQPFVTINNTNNVIKYIIRTAFDGKPGRNTSIEKTFTVYLSHGNYYNHVELFTEIINCTSKTGYPIIFDKYSETKYSARINFDNYADFMLFKVPNGIDNIPLFKNLFFYNYPVNTNYNVLTQTKTVKLFPIHSYFYFCTSDTIVLNIPKRSGIGYGTQIAMVSKNNEGLFYKEYDLISINFETLIKEIFANVPVTKVNENKFIVDTTDILAISLPSYIIKLFNIKSDNLSDDYTLFSMYNPVSANRSSYDITAKTFMITENRLLINYCNNVFTFVEFSE